jgi:acyl dehydratase
MAAPLKVGDRLAGFTREIEEQKMILFERVVWDRGSNSHSDPEAAKRDGMSKVIASGQNQMAFYHELLERNFGDAWVYGGRISARYIHPVYPGDRLTPHGEVTEVAEVDGKPLVIVKLWVEKQDGTKSSVGTAWAGQPSDKRSWIEGGKA